MMQKGLALLLFLSLASTGCDASRIAIAEPGPSVIQTPVAFIPPNFPKAARPHTPAVPQIHGLKRRENAQSGITIIIDPGHGGEDQGAKSLTKPIYCEKNFNLVAARFLQSHLEELGYRTVMTREKDVFVSLDSRAKIPAQRDHEIFVSVHFNAAQSPDADGVEVFYYDAKNDVARTSKSKALATAVFAQVIAATGAKSRGVKHGNYHVIRETTVPAILIEGGFLTNSAELEKIKNPAYLKKLTMGAAQGISNYLQSRKQ